VSFEPIDVVEFEAARLVEEHPPRWRHPNKEVVFQVASAAAHPCEGRVRYARWPKADLPHTASSRSRITVRPGFYDYAPSDRAEAVEWHVNFSDPELFVAYGSQLLAQDELQVAEHPILGSVREALLSMKRVAVTCEPWGGPTPVTVRGAQRRCAIDTSPDPAGGRPRGLYGNEFARASREVVRAATRPLSPPTNSNILAISAPPGGHGTYSLDQVRDVLDTAYSGLLAARHESEALAGAGPRTVVHTGFWGCGAFGGNRHLMTMLQGEAADLADVDLVFHAVDETGVVLVREALDDHARTRDAFPEVDAYLRELANRRFPWGVSDGN
jgi:hypothetical protein